MADLPPLPKGFVLEGAPPLPEGFVPETEEQSRSFLENVRRGGALTARSVLETPGLIAAGIGDIAAKGLNVGIGALDVAGQALGDEPIEFRFDPQGTRRVEEAFTTAGFPEPETPLERVGQDIQRAAVGGAAPIATGATLATRATSPVTRGVGAALAEGPAIQGVSAATGAGSAGAVRESGGTQGQQTLAGLIGGLSPSVVAGTTRAAAQRGLRGGEEGRQAVEETIGAFERAGTTPTVGQATQGRVAQATESLLSRTPGSAGRITSNAQRQADDIAARVERIADDLAPKATAERAGRTIEVGLTGRQGFVQRFQDRASSLYDDVDQHVNTNAPASLDSTQAFLSQKGAPIPGAEATSELLSSPFLNKVRTALTSDLESGAGLPYSTVKALRSRVGEKINSMSLIDDVSKGDLKRLYGALSDDLTRFAENQGPAAARSATRANNFYKGGIRRVEDIERVVNKNGGPEKIFQGVIAGTKEGATTLRTVMKSLKPEEQRMVSAAVVRRMGKATPGQQDVSGEAFSVETFLTNWAKLSPEARGTLFGRFGPEFKKNMDSLASLASNIRQGSGVFRNPSGTQQAITLQTAAGGSAFMAFMGQPKVAAAILGTTGASNLTARLMTNPKFVRFLAQRESMPAGALPAALSTLARETQDEDIARLAALIQESDQSGDQ